MSAYVDPAVYRAELAAMHETAWQLFGTVDELAGARCTRRVLDVDVTVTCTDGELRAAMGRAPARVEILGRFVFVALASSIAPLRELLGTFADVVDAASTHLGRIIYSETEVARANWKHCVEITLDDYHAAAVHPTTFGSGTQMALHNYVYERHGRHSCYLKRRDPDWQFDGFWRDTHAGRFDRTGYKIFNVFPNAIFASMGAMYGATVCTPLDVERTSLLTIIFDWHESPIAADDVPAVVAYCKTFLREDREVCGGLQEAAAINARPGLVPLFGKLEERIAWFQESYQALMTGVP